jgi:hypothetical protein
MRDLDELLDPTVSRRASAAARTPDFAVVERRGLQRRRRARALAVGAAVAVVAAASVVGAQLSSDRLNTEPAVPPGFDDSDGELAQAIDNGDALVESKVPSGDGDSLLTVWSVLDSDQVDPDDPNWLTQYGVTLRVGGRTYWSEIRNGLVQISAVGSDEFLINRAKRADLIGPDGIRHVRFSDAPADLADPEIDAIGPYLIVRGDYFAIDVESATAAPIPELGEVAPGCNNLWRSALRTDQGQLWALERDGDRHELVRHRPDGSETSYVYATQSGGSAASLVQYGGQVAVVWLAPGQDLRVSIPGESSEDIAGYDYPDVGPFCSYGAAVLPDGRLLVHGADAVARSTDVGWQEAEAFPQHFSGRRSALVPSDRGPCVVLYDESVGPEPTAEPTVSCSTDGLTWRETEPGS